MTQTDMQGKICLVTGSTSGLGKATALALAQQNATVNPGVPGQAAWGGCPGRDQGSQPDSYR